MTPARTQADEFAVMLRCNALFGDLGAPMIDRLVRACAKKTLRAGATLFQRGDPGEALYGIRKGRMAIELTSANGQRMTLSILGAGDLLGEIAVLDGGARSADAVALEPVELFALQRRDLLAALDGQPQMAIKLIEIVCARLRSLTDQMEALTTEEVGVRLARRLLALADDFGAEIAITQEQLARFVGVTRESVNRQLNVWQAMGTIELRRGTVVLQKPDGLTTNELRSGSIIAGRGKD